MNRYTTHYNPLTETVVKSLIDPEQATERVTLETLATEAVDYAELTNRRLETMNKHGPRVVYQKIGHHDDSAQNQCYTILASVSGARGCPIATFYDVDTGGGYNASNEADKFFSRLEVATETGFGPRQLAEQRAELVECVKAAIPMLIFGAYESENKQDHDAAKRYRETITTLNSILAKCGKVGG